MKDFRFDEIDGLVKQFDKIPNDWDFLAKLEENGVTASDLKAYTRERKNREDAARRARSRR